MSIETADRISSVIDEETYKWVVKVNPQSGQWRDMCTWCIHFVPQGKYIYNINDHGYCNGFRFSEGKYQTLFLIAWS